MISRVSKKRIIELIFNTYPTIQPWEATLISDDFSVIIVTIYNDTIRQYDYKIYYRNITITQYDNTSIDWALFQFIVGLIIVNI